MVITGKEFDMISILYKENVSPVNVVAENNTSQMELKRLNSGQLLFCLGELNVSSYTDMFLIDTRNTTSKIEDNYIRIGITNYIRS